MFAETLTEFNPVDSVITNAKSNTETILNKFLFFFISQFDRTMEGEKIGIGDLVMRVKGGVEDTFYVDGNGDLIVESNNPDQYKIDKLDGQLIQTVND